MDMTEIKRINIVSATIDLIDEFGIQGVSTREVAKRLDISQGNLFQYFPKKSDLLMAVLNHFSLYDNDLFTSIKYKNLAPREAITFYIDSFAAYYENYPAMIAVMQAYFVLHNDPVLGEKVKNIYEGRLNVIKGLVTDALKDGSVRRDSDTGLISDIIISTVIGICMKWRMRGRSFSLRDDTVKAVEMLLDSFGQGYKKIHADPAS